MIRPSLPAALAGLGADIDQQQALCVEWVASMGPEQLDRLWSNANDTILSPFMGIGSEVYGAVRKGRKAIGIELKPTYYRQAKKILNSLNTFMGVGGEIEELETQSEEVDDGEPEATSDDLSDGPADVADEYALDADR